MISPPVTVCPANTFTPSRLACESRPLREDPRPFLCAIACLRSLLGCFAGRARAAPGARPRATTQPDLGHLDPGQLLPMAGAPLVAALGLELDHPELGPALVAHHARLHADAAEIVAAEDVGAVDVEQRLELHRLALARGQPLDQQGLALLHAILLSAGFHDCVHGYS